MKAILIRNYGGAENLIFGEWEKPIPNENEVLVKVKATALNRADILQREGKYPPPMGASPILGLEIAGEIEDLGKNVINWKIGDKVFGLISGGGYAEYAIIHQAMAIPMPNHLSFETAAAIPEVFLTAFQALHWHARLQSNEKILIHAGASGVGTAAIQLAKVMGAEIFATASASKHATCYELGAKTVIDYQNMDFKETVLNLTDNKGVDVIIDFIGADFFLQNIQNLAIDGRLVMLGFLGGTKLPEMNLNPIILKRLQIIGSTLRSRTLDYQIKLTQDFKEYALDLFVNGTLKPIVDKIFNWNEVQTAHQYMESNQNIGKIVMMIA